MHLLSGKLESDPTKKERVEYYHRKIWDHQEEYKIRTGDYYHAVYKRRE